MPRLSHVSGTAGAAGQSASVGSSQRALSPPVADRLTADASRWAGLAAVILTLGWAYWPNLVSLWGIWSREPNYSHGFLVIPIALLILWQRLQDVKADSFAGRGPWWSWLLLAATLAVRALAYERSYQWVENATIVPAVASLMFALGGWPLLSAGWPAAFFLLFMLPLPASINNTLSLQLQHLATVGSVFTMQLLGILALPDGNRIVLPYAPEGSRVLEVARACNGLSMLMTLAAVVTATIFLIPLKNWKRVVIFLSAIPIALLCNIIRIVGTGWCYHVIEGEKAKKLAHDWSGLLLMMPLALILVFAAVLVLSWLEASDGTTEDKTLRPVLAVIPQAKSDKGKMKGQKDTLTIDE